MTNIFILILLVAAFGAIPIYAFKRSNRCMLKFCFYMTVSENVRKFYCYMLLQAVIIFHFVYYNSHRTEWGLMVSSIPMLLMFSTRWHEWFIKRLSYYRKELLGFTCLTLCALFTPHMFTLGVTFSFILLGVTFYPSSIILDIDRHLVSAEYSRAMITGNYNRMIGCYFGEIR